MTYRFCLLALLCTTAACFDPNQMEPVPQNLGATTTGDTPDPTTATTTGEDIEDDDTTTTAWATSSGGPSGSCDAARTAEECEAASDPKFEGCSWYPTRSYEALSCEPWQTGDGACIIEQGLDGCGEPEATCDDGRSFAYRVVGETVEVVDTSNLCYGLSQFDPCPAAWEYDTSEGTSVGSSTDGSGTSGVATTGFSTSGAATSGGTGDEWTLQDEIAAVCACACD